MGYIPPFQGWSLSIPDTQGDALGWYILPLRARNPPLTGYLEHDGLLSVPLYWMLQMTN